MKTAHQLARELLALPDLPVFHFDPSRAGMDDERDTSISQAIAELTDLSAEEYDREELEPDVQRLEKFIIIHGDGGEPHDESGAFAELTLEALIGAGLLTRETRRVGEDIARKCIEEKA